MPAPNISPENVFWVCSATVGFAYLGYPVLVYLLSRIFGRSPCELAVGETDLPSVSLLIAAYNEEQDIEARVLNALHLDYPASKLEIVIASDGSTDRTNEIVSRYASSGVRLFDYAENRGKATVLNRTVPCLNGDIIVLSDANTSMAADAVRRLAAWFQDPEIGVVCGRLVLTDPRTGQNVDGLYWKYETFLKKCESRLGALLGSNGAIYAIRKPIFPVVNPGTLIDDFVIPLEARRGSGCRIVYDTQALAREETAPTILAEFRRRIRIGAGGFQSIGLLWPMLSPGNGWVALTFFCHKILRWTCPFFLIGALLANLFLLGDPFYDAVFLVQLAFYGAALIGNWLPAKPRGLRYFRLPTMFATMNAALLFGFFRWLFQRQTGVWARTDRVSDPIQSTVFGTDFQPRIEPVGDSP
jgi:cellulose synthase/poly-beta-1,6-N-acetylglucosamine synthase-like glycosyltransferase